MERRRQGMNKVILIGYLGQEPEMKYFESGSKVTRFSLALNNYNKKDQKEVTDWINCEAWGKTAEAIGEYCKKGHKVAIDGSLKTQQWQDDAGNKKSKTVVLVGRVEFLTSKNKSEKCKASQPEPQQEPTQGSLDMEIPAYESEIPY